MEDVEVIQIDTQPAVSSMKALRNELKKVKDSMASLDAGSDAFLEAANKAGELKHQIDEINQSVAGASSDFGDMLGNVTKIGAGITGAFQTANAALSMFGIESEEVVKSIKTMQSLMAMTQGLASIDAAIKSINKLRNSITATTAASKLLKAALTPKTFLAVVAAVTALVLIFKKLSEGSKEFQEQEKKRLETIEKEKQAQDKLTTSIGDCVAQYRVLQMQYGTLESKASKQKWIDDNASAFKSLGIEIKGVNDADRIFIQQSEQVIVALTKRAQAAAAQAALEESLKEVYKRQANVLQSIGTSIRGEQNFNMVSALYGLDSDDYTITYKKIDGYWTNVYTYTEKGLNKIKDFLLTPIRQEEESILSTLGNIAAEAKLSADQAMNAINGTGSSSTDKKAEDKIQKQIELEYALLELKKQTNREYGKSKQAIEDYLTIQQKELDHLKDLGKEGTVEYVKLQTAIAKTNNEITDFGKTVDKLTAQEKQLAEIELAEKGVDLEYAKGKINDIQYAEQILVLEQAKLSILKQGTEEWYNQAIAVENYRKNLEDAKKSTEKLANSLNRTQQVGQMGFQALADTLNAFADMQDVTTREGFEQQKKLQIAAVTMNMLSGVMSAWTSAMNPANAWMTIWGQIAAGTAQTIATLAMGAAQIAKIKQTQFDGGGSSSASASSSSIGSIIAPVQYTSDVQGAQIESAIKDTRVYVTESDISTTQHRVSVAENENRY